METVVSTKGQLVIPAELREEDGISPGDKFKIEKIATGKYVLHRIEGAPNKGLTDWLLGCPVKGWFTPIPSENTDTL